jgi:hypothetical protein
MKIISLFKAAMNGSARPVATAKKNRDRAFAGHARRSAISCRLSTVHHQRQSAIGDLPAIIRRMHCGLNGLGGHNP